MSLLLYRRRDCALCDLAALAVRDAGCAAWHEVDVGWEGELAARYGWTLPVLRDADSGRELAWPFDAWRLREWLGT